MKRPPTRSPIEFGKFPFKVVTGEAQRVLRSVPDGVISAVVTSPPYWGLRTYGHPDEIGRESTLEEYIGRLVEIFREVRRVLAQDGVVWLVMGDAYTAGHRTYRADDKRHKVRGMAYRPRTPAGLKEKDLIGLPWRVAFALQADGWYLRTDVIWAKPNPIPESVRDRPHRSHEFVFMLTKAPKYYFDSDGFAHPTLAGGQYARTVWSVSVGQRQSGHPAAFPLELVTPCVLSSTKPRAIVLDPFAGSCSVGLTCLRLGRRFLGIEILRAHVVESRKMLRQLSKQNEFESVRLKKAAPNARGDPEVSIARASRRA